MKQKTFDSLTWGLVVLSLILSLLVWGDGIAWQFGSINAYQWFPLFGLIAWLVMATHYFSGALRITHPYLKKPAYYSKVTSFIVLASLLLHPGILAYSQWRNGFGFPPNSFVEYVGESLLLASMLGSIALTLFLAFEIFDRLKEKAVIKKNWWLVSISQTVAMMLVFIHALRLGGDLDGWFLAVWLSYGMLLLPCFYIIHSSELSSLHKKNKSVQERQLM